MADRCVRDLETISLAPLLLYPIGNSLGFRSISNTDIGVLRSLS